MDAQRLVLIASLAIVSYLLVLAWNEDYGQPISAPHSQITTPALREQPSALPDQDLPTRNTDLPSADLATKDVPSIIEKASPAALSPANPITVVTDVLTLHINPVGGDIIYAALNAYPRIINRKNDPFVLLEHSAERTYVAQSGLIGTNGLDSSGSSRPVYQAQQTEYKLAEGANELTVDLVLTDVNNVTVTKRYRLTRGEYLINLEYLIDNQSETSWQANFFAQFKRDNSPDPSQTTSMGMKSFVGAATTSTEERYQKLDFEDFAEKPLKLKNTGGWIAILQHYFVSAWVPNKDQLHTYQTRKNSQGENIAGLISPALVVPAGQTGTTGAQLYVGPKIQDRLGNISPSLELTVDYGWLWFIAQPLFWLLSTLHGFLGNWGWAIIFTTLSVKLAFFKLSATSYKSMANMRRVGPELQRLKERFGDDRQKMSTAMMELYKKEKINPLGGCLPILVQMPVFIALYWVLLESVELRQAPFMLWLNDLSVKDPYFILPIIMGATMWFQQTLNPEPPDPMQAKVMKMMPIMFTFFFLWFPAGLVLYWVVNNLLSIAQQWVITKQIEKLAGVKGKN
ncbi:MAG: membrane protein insertase YidC [Pseudomonadales bacterium]|nr:membrane protein insertase YidC [Pseudomonadales bacterium]MCP5216360.1 membrane protein insertase YidC [Pseudomonadales bacterium]